MTSHYTTYELNLKDPSVLSQFSEVLLEDLMADSIHDLKYIPTYSFHSSLTDSTGRFLIYFKTSSISPINNSQKTKGITIRSFESDVIIEDKSGKATISEVLIFNTLGQLVRQQSHMELISGCGSIHMNEESGMFIIKVINDDQIFTGKVYLK